MSQYQFLITRVMSCGDIHKRLATYIPPPLPLGSVAELPTMVLSRIVKD
jgi:hypothetical protein